MDYWRQANFNFVLGIPEEMMSTMSQDSHSTRISFPKLKRLLQE